MTISSASSSVSASASTRPVDCVCMRQPPSSSESISWRMALDVTRPLATAMVAPRRMTTKSERQAYHVEDP
ncbi:Uncharacterised protein [Bordetella pertussis]|nr:Uncharacterised protein [Bordetella pertussis]